MVAILKDTSGGASYNIVGCPIASGENITCSLLGSIPVAVTNKAYINKFNTGQIAVVDYDTSKKSSIFKVYDISGGVNGSVLKLSSKPVYTSSSTSFFSQSNYFVTDY